MFFKCENDCLQAYVEPNMVNTAKHLLCSVSYVAGSAFQVLRINVVVRCCYGVIFFNCRDCVGLLYSIIPR